MSCRDIVDLSGDDDDGRVDVKSIKLELVSDCGRMQAKCYPKANTADNGKSKMQHRKQDSEENRSSIALSAGQSSNSVLEQGQSPVDDTGISSSPICPAPLCRQFWKAGSYENGLGSKVTLQNGKNFLHVHPMFLHSNATSHKWVFGAVAELLDNAVDEIQNGATYVIVDKITNPRDGSVALLIQDDGGGMDPQAMRRCMSFGFSDKKSKSTIGRYGNGFKTSSMRLGADVIVFSRHVDDRTSSQSIGLLSYTFLTHTGLDRIVVPMVDYDYETSTGTLKALNSGERFMSNLSLLLQWSPYSSEAELLKQFDDLGTHGTKIIIYNLWFNDDGNMELDFDSDPEDICISGGITNKYEGMVNFRAIHDKHIANRFHYSLRVYLSVLYLRIPGNFSIILREKVVEHHNIADDLKFPEFILYKPQAGGHVEGAVVTTIGFLKDAPHVSIHGFNVYHKNRLILPFWPVVNYTYRDSRGRGIVGILEANFVEPTHNKQEFERTSLFQKLEARLKEMTLEYWLYHCEMIGYQVQKKRRASVSQLPSSPSTPQQNIHQPVALNRSSTAVHSTQASSAAAPHPLATTNSSSLFKRAEQSIPNSEGRVDQSWRKRKEHRDLSEFEKVKTPARKGVHEINSGQSVERQPLIATTNQLRDEEAMNLIKENKKLRTRYLEYEKSSEELNHKVTQLRSELEKYNSEYERLLAELKALADVKHEKSSINM